MRLATLLLYMVDFVEEFGVGPGVESGNFPELLGELGSL